MVDVSVIMPLFNGEKFLRNSIESVLNQKLFDLELIIIDDCSTDRSVSIVNEYINKDKRVKLFRTPYQSGGPSLGRNIGIAHASGRFISFLDSDDMDHPDKLYTAKNIFDTYSETDVVFFDVIGMSESGHHKVITYNKDQHLVKAKGYLTCLKDDVYQCSNRYFACMAGIAVGISTQGIVIKKAALHKFDYLFSLELK